MSQPKRPRSQNRRLPKMVGTRLSEIEEQRLAEAAKAAGVTRSTFVRDLILRATWAPCPECRGYGYVARPMPGQRWGTTGFTGYTFTGLTNYPCPRGCSPLLLVNADRNIVMDAR